MQNFIGEFLFYFAFVNVIRIDVAGDNIRLKPELLLGTNPGFTLLTAIDFLCV